MNIKQKQWQLYYLGYYHGTIDGIWGSMSMSATGNFQRDNNLDPDGIFGPNTESKSIEIIRLIQEVIGTTPDGLAGNNTKSKTKEWQKNNGLNATGIADAKTRAKIQKSIKAEEEDQSWWDDIMYFERSEFKCKCGGRYCNGYPAEPKKLLVQVADRSRDHFGAPAIVSSGVRCEIHNRNVGGVSDSRHKLGKAMDFSISGRSASEVLAYVNKQPEIRYAYAIDDSYVHMDIY